MPGETLQLFLRGLEGKTRTIDIDKVTFKHMHFRNDSILLKRIQFWLLKIQLVSEYSWSLKRVETNPELWKYIKKDTGQNELIWQQRVPSMSVLLFYTIGFLFVCPIMFVMLLFIIRWTFRGGGDTFFPSQYFFFVRKPDYYFWHWKLVNYILRILLFCFYLYCITLCWVWLIKLFWHDPKTHILL